MSSIRAESVVRQHLRTASTSVEGQAVVMTIDDQGLHNLNAVGTFVWDRAGEEGCAVAELVDAVVAHFEIDRPQAEKDVLEFIDQLVTLGALESVG